MSNSSVFDFVLFIEKYLATPLHAAYGTFHLYTFNFHPDSSSRYLKVGSALGAEVAYNDH